MKDPVRILHLEDSPRDAALVTDLLETEGLACVIRRVADREAFAAALAAEAPDVILCDYNLPDYDGLAAVKLARERLPLTPVIVISGSIAADKAVECLREGATDYLLKQRLDRLPSAIRQAVAGAMAHRDRLHAEAELRASEARQRFVLEKVHTGGWELDLVDHTAHRTLEHDRIFGYTALLPQWTYEMFLEHVLPEDRAEVDRRFRAVTAAQAEWSFECRIRRTDGEVRWIWATGEHQRDTAGQARRMAGVVQDITERKRAETQIREQSEILEFAREAIIITGLDHRAIFWNRGAERLYGWTAAEALGRTAKDLFEPGVLARMIVARNYLLRHGEWAGEISQHDNTGQAVFAEVRAYLVRDAADQPRAILFLATDTTENRKLKEQVQHAQRMENLGLLASGIAHDFNNALAPIIMGGPLLRPHMGNAVSQRILDTMEKSAARSAALVRQLLSFARGASGQNQLLQLRHVLKEVIELGEATFPKSIRLESHLPSELRLVQGNPTQFHQIFLNLCVNARDAMPSGGVLTVTAANVTLDAVAAADIPAARPGIFVTVEVRDTGTGIPPDVLARIWEPFYTTKGEGKGTGLGLSTVRAILHEHDCFVTVKTAAGHGTAFTIYLPAQHGGESGGSAHPLPARPAEGKGELILVVDDEEPVRSLAAKILVKHGYRTLTASDGADAITVFAPCAAEVRLLLTDMQMPVLGGPALANALRRLRPDLPVVAMSGADSTGSAAHKEFTTAFLAKPFQVETLLAIVRATLDAPPPGASPPAN